MRRNIVHDGADKLKYEIREIVDIAHKLQAMGLDIAWENIGDPVQKGEEVPLWIKDIIKDLVMNNRSYAYDATVGHLNTRKYLSDEVNKRGGCQITENDIIFFNGLGDAVSTLFMYLKREARVLGPSPAYSTLSSGEAAHSGYEHTTYKLDPDNNWMPDLEDMENKVKYNDSIAGILLINPDNPTGTVYTREFLEQIVDIARKYDLFVLCDETYAHIVYNGAETVHLSEVIGDVPGIALRSISKEYPWPGGRCGWMEVFNQQRDNNFKAYIKSLVDAKRLEVCSTTLPQMSIPYIFSDPRYIEHLNNRNRIFEKRAEQACDILSGIKGITVNMPSGAFYLTIKFDDNILTDKMTLKITDSKIRSFIESSLDGLAVDKRFVYYMLAAKGICVVPLSGFCSKLHGFRMTLLETDDEKRIKILNSIKDSINEYLSS